MPTDMELTVLADEYQTKHFSDVALYCGEQILEGKKSLPETLALWSTFLKADESIPVNKEYGRVYITEQLTRLYVTILLSQGEQEASLAESHDIELPSGATMSRWSSSDWTEGLEHLRSIQANLLRNDADRLVTKESDEPDESTHVERGRENLYKGRLDKLGDYFTLNEAFAPIRGILCDQLEEGKTGAPKVPAKLLNEFSNKISKLNSKRVKESLLGLTTSPTDSTAKKHTLKPLEELQELMKHAAFDLDVVTKKVLKLLKDWCMETFPERPTLNKAYHPDVVANLSAKRKGLRRKGGEDPKEEAIRLSRMAVGSSGDDDDDDDDSDSEEQQAITPRGRRRSRRRVDPSPKIPSTAATPIRERGHLLQKKRSAQRMEFTQEDDDSIEEDDSSSEGDEVNASAHLSSLPSPAKGSSKSKKRRQERTSLSPAKKLRSQDKKYDGRRKWSDEEVNAIKAGVRKLGAIGKWAEVKDTYSEVLDFRTSTQIKDKWRTMARKGEVDDIYEELNVENEYKKKD